MNAILANKMPPSSSDLAAEQAMSPQELAHHKALEKQTEKWVGSSFYGTLLKQMHDSPFKSDMFEGGRGGQAYNELYDQKLADRMSKGAAHSLVRSIVKSLEKAQAVKMYSRHATRAETILNVPPVSSSDSAAHEATDDDDHGKVRTMAPKPLAATPRNRVNYVPIDQRA